MKTMRLFSLFDNTIEVLFYWNGVACGCVADKHTIYLVIPFFEIIITYR